MNVCVDFFILYEGKTTSFLSVNDMVGSKKLSLGYKRPTTSPPLSFLYTVLYTLYYKLINVEVVKLECVCTDGVVSR